MDEKTEHRLKEGLEVAAAAAGPEASVAVKGAEMVYDHLKEQGHDPSAEQSPAPSRGDNEPGAKKGQEPIQGGATPTPSPEGSQAKGEELAYMQNYQEPKGEHLKNKHEDKGEYLVRKAHIESQRVEQLEMSLEKSGPKPGVMK